MRKKSQDGGKPTPVRNAALAVSATCNAFLFWFAYAVITGQLAHVETLEPQQVALYSGNYTQQGAKR